jgi:Cd2+/Zn2+-exporting ATPase
MNSLSSPEIASRIEETHEHCDGCGHLDHHHHNHSSGGCEHHDHGEAGLQRRLLFVIVGAVFLLLGAILQWLRPGEKDLAVAWAMGGAVLTSIPIVLDAWRGLWASRSDNNSFYMNQFVTLAVFACFATGQYFTAGIVAIVLLVGHILEDRSMLGTNEAIDRLVHLARATARRLRDGREEEVDAEDLSEGDRVRVRPGDTLPADGTVVAGFSTVNQASITGESLPAEAGSGTSVFAGTVNLTGVLEVEVTRTGSKTVLGRVKDIVEEAQQSRAPIMRITEEYARYYLPLILLIAGFTLFFTRDVQRAISVIVVSIPCTFVLAGPSAMVAALAAASRMGILVKSVRFFEAANGVETVVFDKTGTLTTGELGVAVVRPESGISETRLLALAAAVEQHSSHPVARAVVAAARERQIIYPDAVEVQEAHGFGLAGEVDGVRVLIGRAKWLEEHRIIRPETPEEFGNLSALYVAIDGAYAGVLYLGDTIRPEAAGVVSRLRKQGLDEIVMLTGDRRGVAVKVAAEVGIENLEADCLPEQKQTVVQRLREAGKDVMVVGDGVNDAPALAAGSLSIAMGALGSDVAIQTADVALMSSDLTRIPHFLALSDKALRIINQNMLCGFAFIGAAIVLSGVGLIPPIAAAFVHEIGAFFVIFNSARLLRFEGEET